MKIEFLQRKYVAAPTFTKAVSTINRDASAPETQDTVDLKLTKAEKKAEIQEKLAQQQEKLKADQQELQRQMDSAKKQGEAMAKAADTKMKCMIIAQRIMAGDKVPKEDYQYLSKNDTELYAKAITLRASNPEPKKHKRVSPDEEEGGAVQNADSATQAAPFDSAPQPEPSTPESGQIDVKI